MVLLLLVVLLLVISLAWSLCDRLLRILVRRVVLRACVRTLFGRRVLRSMLIRTWRLTLRLMDRIVFLRCLLERLFVIRLVRLLLYRRSLVLWVGGVGSWGGFGENCKVPLKQVFKCIAGSTSNNQGANDNGKRT